MKWCKKLNYERLIDEVEEKLIDFNDSKKIKSKRVKKFVLIKPEIAH